MNIYLRTRGELRHLDYDFLGVAPPRAWWRDYNDVNAAERPSVLAAGDAGGWRLYLGGIPSKRVDTVNTLIVYSVVIEGDGDTSAEDRALAGRLVAAWAAAIAGDITAEPLTDALDAAFPREDVETWLAAKGEEARAAWPQVTARVREVVQALPEPPATEPRAASEGEAEQPGERVSGARTGDASGLPEFPARWIAGVRRPDGRARYLERVTAILGGEPGEAHILNMIAKGADVATLPSPRLAVLIEGSAIGDPATAAGPVPPLTAREEREAGDPKARQAPAEVRGGRPGPVAERAVKVAAALIAAGLLAWVIYRVLRTGTVSDE
ncbi:hypothetical protein Skr01_03740 [Sphaerisporangium krabiense]|uniref:Uncharacterized protein n=1 Tax=Sphaerisporangium krabiense TaxID=763782 RepID=A0A7W9DSY7_9ACTN|nr:hypothetical protein [Sphaerisporangium krabiense]MBB5628870.1 hypothetical protein [Sphaerisporangium krabiense]GII60289.1 hypothetical protein Skr01_03740 [Sphaerisporangium krabiense]